LREKFAGAPLKSIAISMGATTVRGECVITRHGVEGGAIYTLSATLRDEIERAGFVDIAFDLRPDASREALTARLAAPRGKQSMANVLRKAGLTAPAAALLRESGPLPATAQALADRIKSTPVRLVSARPIERAISTAGGVRFDEIRENLMLKKVPGVFVAGEMIDWEATTGGYLLQACLATGAFAGRTAAEFAARNAS